MTEEEKRFHRCCFTGHRPEKLQQSEEEVKAWLSEQIDRAITDGYTTFITGMAMGVDLWAAKLVLEKKKTSDIHLIAATPWPGFAARWNDEWKQLYGEVWQAADFRVTISEHYFNGIFQKRNVWMVDHSRRVIAFYNGSAGGTKNTIDYARKKDEVEIVTMTGSESGD